jgi:hypothetical protein
VKERRHQSALRRWQNPEFRKALLDYHRSEETRRERSEAQTKRMLKTPEKWCRGRGAWVTPEKCSRSPIWTRSSYERVVVKILDSDTSVLEYHFEPRLELPGGRWILPDFVVRYGSGVVLIEVKASWVLELPEEHKIRKRLRQASSFAFDQGWDFRILTEKDFGNVERSTTR